VAKLEEHETSLACARTLPLGVAEIDRMLGGGLAPASLHEVLPCARGDLVQACRRESAAKHAIDFSHAKRKRPSAGKAGFVPFKLRHRLTQTAKGG